MGDGSGCCASSQPPGSSPHAPTQLHPHAFPHPHGCPHTTPPPTPHTHRHETSHEHVAHVLPAPLPTTAELAGLDLHALASANLPEPYGSGGAADGGEESSGSAAGAGSPSGPSSSAAAGRSPYTDALGEGDAGQLHPFSPAVSSA